MLTGGTLIRRSVIGSRVQQCIHIGRSKRRIWTSAANMKTTEDVKKFAISPHVEKHKKIMIPDFTKLKLLSSVEILQTLKGYADPANLQLILAAANSDKHANYDDISAIIAQNPNMDSTLVVKGSSMHALGDTPMVHEQWVQMIKAVKRGGGRVMQPLRIDLSESDVLRDIERRMLEGCDGFMTHPVFDGQAVTPGVIKVLRAIRKEHPDFVIRVGTLMMTEEMYDRVQSRDGKLVSPRGLDLYKLPPKPEDGDWGQWNAKRLEGVKGLVKGLGLDKSIKDATYSRIGIGHSVESVEKIAASIEGEIRELDLGGSDGPDTRD